MNTKEALIEQGRLLDAAIVAFVRQNPYSPVQTVRMCVAPDYTYNGIYAAVRRLTKSGKIEASRIGNMLLLRAPAEAANDE